MAYTTNIPASTDIPAQSQPLMQDNCNQIATALAVDHGAFNAATEGQHNKISFTGTGAIPTTNFGLYATAAAMLAHNAGANYDITTLTNTFAGGYGQGSVTLPSGLVIKFGRKEVTGNEAIGFTNNFATNALAGFVSVQNGNLPVVKAAVLISITVNTINVRVSNYAGTANDTAPLNWLVVGY